MIALIWRLTKGKVHATDATNASRTMIYNITHASITGKSIPINGVVGDQQSATIGQCCFEPGSLEKHLRNWRFCIVEYRYKKIYSKNRLLTTIAYRINGKTTYAMEGVQCLYFRCRCSMVER